VGYFANAGVILVEVIFGLAVTLFVVRVLLQLVRANFHNPVCQFFYKATNPVLMPLRKVLPPWRGLDLAACLIALLLECVKVWLLWALLGVVLNLPATLVLGFADLVSFVLMLYFGLMLVGVILSWIPQSGYHPIVPLITQLTAPVLRPIRRVLPILGGFDLSTMVAMVGILIAQALVVAPLHDLGKHLAGG
jgi:YggT family protein